jgi:preprotein translocase subunit SecF
MAKKNGITHRLYTGEISYDFIGHRRLWYSVTGVLLLICVLAVAFKGLALGIEFRGGADFAVPVASGSNLTADDARNAVAKLNFPDNDDITVTNIGDSQIRVQTRALTTEEVTEVKAALGAVANIPPEQVDYALIGASWGQQITTQGLIALVVFLALVMVLIWVYFRDFKMSVSALLALLHDLVVTVGVYALVGFTVTPSTLIGVLTILGYSLYDTVVVFDKVRENVADLFDSPYTYSQQANKSVNQVLVRSLNTTVIGVLPVAALLIGGAFILGTGPLKDLGLALFVGMIAGTYSSIFIATPLLAQMREREPLMREHRLKLERRKSRRAKNAAFKDKAGVGVLAQVGVAVEGSSGDDADVPTVIRVVEPSAGRAQPSRQTRSQRKK